MNEHDGQAQANDQQQQPDPGLAKLLFFMKFRN
jgi:hypothetical protein